MSQLHRACSATAHPSPLQYDSSLHRRRHRSWRAFESALTHALPLAPVRQAARALLRAALVAAALRGAGAQYCSPGAATVCDAVLVVCGEYLAYCADVRSTLLGPGAFATVDTFDANHGTPTAELLAAYHAVLVYSVYPFSDPALLGDCLAAYPDQGGGVVVAPLALDIVASLQGAYGAPVNGYALLDYASGSFDAPSDMLGEVLEP